MESKTNTISEMQEIICSQAYKIRKLESLLHKYDEQESVKFLDFFSNWLNKQVHLESNTFETYQSQYRNHILPYFSALNKSLSAISNVDIESFYEYKLKSGLNSNTVIRLHSQLYSCFKYALRQDAISSNPMDKVSRPKETPFIPKWLSADEVCILLAKTTNHKLFAPIFIAVMLGLRRSEVLALKWEDINLSLGTVSIKSKKIHSNQKDVDVKKLKTKSSYRTLILPESLLAVLKKIKSQQDLLKELVPKEYKQNFKYVCVDIVDKKGELLTLTQVTNGFRRLIDNTPEINKVRFHDLRHSCATFLLHSNTNMKNIQEWLGHSNFNTTAKFYAHVDINDKKRTAASMDKILSGLNQKAE